MTSSYTFRPSQQKILGYRGGRLGIAAVPGAGKTFTLSALAAQIISSGALESDQEVLIVTLVNSAVENFSNRISAMVEQKGLIPHLGYRVRTLHGLAHDLVREKPGRVGLEERFSIVDEAEAAAIRRDAAQAWLAAHAESLTEYLDPQLEPSKRDWVLRQQLPAQIESLALAFIRSAKDSRQTPDSLRARLDSCPENLPLAEMGLAIYSDYQRALAYRGAVDFDDLIRLSLDLLESDPDFLERLRYRYPYILEDEAQDSSQLQEKILGLMSGPDGNWVRVGDPNQAIFETFTTASPELLRRFIAENPSEELPESGRSQPAIIDAANRLIEWVINEHPNPQARAALAPPWIKPAPQGDPQPNPPADPTSVRFIRGKKFSPDEELEQVAVSVKKYLQTFDDLPADQKPTVAILDTKNARGVEIASKLKEKGLECVEVLSTTDKTRRAAGSLSNLLAYLAEPGSAAKLSRAYQVWRRESFRGEGSAEDKKPYQQVAETLKKLGRVEDFLAPNAARDWLAGFSGQDSLQENASAASPSSFFLDELLAFRATARRWLEAVILPIDQLTLTLAQDVFSDPADLALAHKLALLLKQSAQDHADWRLPELTAELALIAKNERRFVGFSSDDAGFDPEKHRGKVVVTTMHRAKGLEWERVYLMSVNNYDFPSGAAGDQFMSERWFLRDNLNLEAEALAQLRVALADDAFSAYEEGAATEKARLDYVKERLRLLYVGITRARRDLIVTWNTGRRGEARPALAFEALK
ncbi:MAG: ATP-dependent helicase [Anaerolineales bacterium]